MAGKTLTPQGYSWDDMDLRGGSERGNIQIGAWAPADREWKTSKKRDKRRVKEQ